MFPELLPNRVVGKDAQQLMNIYVYTLYIYIGFFPWSINHWSGGGGFFLGGWVGWGSFVVTAFLK